MKRWIPFALWLLFVGAIIFCADRSLARPLFDFVAHHSGSDKLGHLFLIGTLAFTLNYALRARTVPLKCCRVQLGGLIVAVAMTLEECSQIWIPSRTFDLLDLAANYTGILCAGWLTRRFVRGNRAMTSKPSIEE